MKRHFKPLLYLALCTISTELYARMDITMLNVMQTNTQVGLYSYAHKVINIVITFVVAVTAVFLPRLSYYYEKQKDKFNELVQFGMNLMILISIPTSVGLLILAKPTIVLLFGKDFNDAASILCILIPMIPLKCIGDIICYQVMMSANKESILMKSYFIVMIVNFVNNLLLIPRLGASGAAVASVISEVLAFIFVFHYSRRIAIIQPDKRNIVCSAVMSMIMGCTLYVLANSFSMSNILLVFLGVLAGVLIYVVGNVLFKNSFFTNFLCSARSKIKSR